MVNLGIALGNITILIATGLHRPNEGKELEDLIGDPWVLKTVKVQNHFARDDGAHVEVGITKKGNRVLLDKRFVFSDLKIVRFYVADVIACICWGLALGFLVTGVGSVLG